jgi:site-specific recombinase XerD
MNKKSDGSFFQLVRSFLTVYLPKSRCYSRNTVIAYRDAINLFRIFMKEQKHVSFAAIAFDGISHSLV